MKENKSQDLLKNISFCVFDLETTGGNHKSDKIIEIGLVKIENLKITEQKDYLINPEIKIPDFIQKLTNICEEDVKDSPVIEEVIDDIVEFMGDSVLVAHNTSFDVPFFNSVLRRLKKKEMTNKSICTNTSAVLNIRIDLLGSRAVWLFGITERLGIGPLMTTTVSAG